MDLIIQSSKASSKAKLSFYKTLLVTIVMVHWDNVTSNLTLFYFHNKVTSQYALDKENIILTINDPLRLDNEH